MLGGAAAAAALLTLAGALLPRSPRLAAWATRAVAWLLLWFSIPLLTLHTVSLAMPGDPVLQKIALLGIVFTITPLAVYRALLVPRCGCPGGAAAAFAAGIGNVIFLPTPLALLAGFPVDAVVAYSIGYTVAVAALVPVLGCSGGSPARYPPAYALALGIALALVGTPAWLENLLHRLHAPAAWATLLSFLLVGESVARLWPPRLERCAVTVAAWRSLASPALHSAAAALLGLSGTALGVVMLESVMPPATMNIVFARLYGLDENIVASTIALLTPLSLVEALFILQLAGT